MDSGTSSMAIAHSSYHKFMAKLNAKGKKHNINSWPDITYKIFFLDKIVI